MRARVNYFSASGDLPNEKKIVTGFSSFVGGLPSPAWKNLIWNYYLRANLNASSLPLLSILRKEIKTFN